MEILRTPDERFAGLVGYCFKPRYVEVAGADGVKLRVHYIDEGEPGGEAVLLCTANRRGPTSTGA